MERQVGEIPHRIRKILYVSTRLGIDLTGPVNRKFISDRVLRPDETVSIISTEEPQLARKMQAIIANPENFITYCYCSIFEQCWLADSRSDMQNPELVEICPDFGDDTFRN